MMPAIPTRSDWPAPASRSAEFGAMIALFGVVLSGPLAMILVMSTHPQPTWQGPALYVRSYHWVQILPYFAGLLLVTGFVILVASLHQLACRELKPLTTIALIFTSVFATLISFNYVVQTTFLPALVRDYRESSAALVAAFSMSNPRSLAWGVEMWGYGFLGVATWLVAPVFSGTRLERTTAVAFAANGVISVAGALLTAARPGWVVTSLGMAAYVAWNLLVAVMALLAALALRRRSRVSALAPPGAPRVLAGS